MTMTEALDALRFPLWGSRLIEASAGTGKTWTIAALYLRLVLGHGEPADTGAAGAVRDSGATAPPRPLQPAEILVMTFTRAATRELSDRIRARLSEAARCFRGEASVSPDDTLLQALLAAYPDGPARQQASFRLASAAESMDDAAVHTIDAWCQRMLREHAFDSGNLFEEELLADEALLREQAVRDVWRQQLYPLQGDQLDAVLAVWPSIDALAEDVRQLLPKVDLLQPDRMPAAAGDDSSLFDAPARLPRSAAVIDLPALLAEHTARLAGLKAGWGERAAEMRGWLVAQFNSPKNPYSGAKLKAPTVEELLDALAAWAQQPLRDRPAFNTKPSHKAREQRLTPNGLADCLKKNCHAEPPAVFNDFAALLDALAQLPSLATRLRQQAALGVAARLAELKQRAGRFGFADLLERLDQALAGPRGEALRRRIVEQYPVALVDEFQDTSPRQFSLFDRLYRTADNAPATGLFLIGDPKQSIYGFRGADIYSYLAARAATAGRHYALSTNFRSTEGVVIAVNRLFERAEQAGRAAAGLASASKPAEADAALTPAATAAPGRGATGAFHFPVTGALQLPFEPVLARGRPERLVCAAGELAALTLASDGEPLPAAALRRRYAMQCAERIVALLNDPQAGFAAEARFTRLLPADIAVLVRTRHEADAVRRALRERGVASVFLSDQDTVLASREAVDLLHWLRAVAEPRDARLARVAYAGGSFGLPLAELGRVVRDDEAWDVHQTRLVQLQRVWQRQGVLAMLRQTLHALDLPARWLAEPGGERCLTNVLHLAELLQTASSQLDGEQALIRWLAEQVADHAAGRGEGGDDRIVRLESDAGLVQVITVHKSKGLEYPLVFLPFAGSARPVDRKGRRFVEQVDDSGRRELDFALGDAAIDAADRERLREELRLLYVALTRARHALWLGIGLPRYSSRGAGEPRTTLHRSALGHLLGVTAPGPWTPEQVGEALAEIARGAAGQIRCETLSEPDFPTRLVRRADDPPLLDAPDYHGHIDADWTVGSFSALVRDLGGEFVRGAAPADASLAGSRAGSEHDTSAWLADDGSLADDEIGDPARPAARLRLPIVPAIGRLLGDVLHEEALREEGADLPLPPTGQPLDTQARHRFPRGALPGNFLHEQLETLAGMGFAQAGSEEFLRLLARRCERQGRAYRAEDVGPWLQAVAQTTLPPLGAALVDVPRHLSEMEFWLPSAGLHAAGLDALCHQHLLPGRPRPALPARRLRGLLMGFADLVFEHGGRYWVLDYKSNALGDSDAAYTPEAMQHAMLQHRYELQAALYQLALHRLLRARLGAAYDPDEHLGGAIYLFLRGIAGPAQGCVHLPANVELLAALDALLGESQEEIA
jgi:exodeoxyribonuclease V beta subunit